MIQIRWEHFVALLLFVAGVFLSAGAWLSYGIRVAVVNDHAEELGGLTTQLASQVNVERVGYIVAGSWSWLPSSSWSLAASGRGVSKAPTG